MRPCILPTHWKQKKPIDACEVSGIQSFYEVGSKDKYHITINFWNGDTIQSPQIKEAKHYDCANAKKELNHIQFLIYDALNAPVLATEEVLAGLPTEAKFLIRDTPSGDWKEYTLVYHYYGDRILTNKGRRVSIGEITSTPSVIKPNGCHKTADYLRQFTLQGVRKETKND
jgi:hypothetical protein